MSDVLPNRITTILGQIEHVVRFMADSRFASRQGDPSICDFCLGNPHEMPLSEFSAALGRWSVPQNKDWFAYKMSEPAAREVIVTTLREQRGLDFEVEDIFLTNGAFAAIAVALAAIVHPGDEVIFVTPPWFFYEAMITAQGGTPVRATIDRGTFDLDVDSIAAAISDRTRAIIVNSPNNPTGKIYPPSTLERLSAILSSASARIGHTIYVLSDEAYSRILFDGRAYPSPAFFYPNTFVLYTYGKTLLTPGQRLGYIALPPTMRNREQLRIALLAAQLVAGWAFPNALLQHALADIEGLSIDVVHLQQKRDRMVSELRKLGYELHVPEGTFYLLVRSPLADDLAFLDLLADYDVFCLPGTIVEMPGYFRISLTANDEMIERSLPGFAAAMQRARATA